MPIRLHMEAPVAFMRDNNSQLFVTTHSAEMIQLQQMPLANQQMTSLFGVPCGEKGAAILYSEI